MSDEQQSTDEVPVYTGPTAGAALRTTANARELAEEALAEVGLDTGSLDGTADAVDEADTAVLPVVGEPPAAAPGSPESAPEAPHGAEPGAPRETGTTAGATAAPDAAGPAEEAAPTTGSPAGDITLPDFRKRSRSRRILKATERAADKVAQSSGRASRKLSEYLVRSAKTRIQAAQEEADTQPIPIVAVLRGTPYQEPIVAERKSEDEARMILDLAVDIGAVMLRAGANTSDVDVCVIATCTAMGLETAEVDIMHNSITAHYSDPDGRLHTVMRVMREQRFHYAKLSAVHTLVLDIIDHKAEFDEARERIDAIRWQRRPHTEWTVTLAFATLAAAVVVLVGGGVFSTILGFVTALLNDRFARLLGRIGLPEFFSTMAMAGFTTFVAMTAWNFDIVSSPQFIVTSSVVLLLPTQKLVSVVQDAITRFPITAAGRSVEVVLGIAGIVSGIASALMLGRAIGMETIDVLVEVPQARGFGIVLGIVASFVIAATGAVGMQTRKRIILPAALVGTIGYLVLFGLTRWGMGNIVTTFIAATVIGFLCRPTALRQGSPATVMIIPAVLPILQGMAVFSAVYTIVQPSEYVPLATGLGALFAAIVANAAIAVGVVLGDWLAQPVSKRLGSRDIESAGEEAQANLEAEADAGDDTTAPEAGAADEGTGRPGIL